jgi:hypothetical protein
MGGTFKLTDDLPPKSAQERCKAIQQPSTSYRTNHDVNNQILLGYIPFDGAYDVGVEVDGVERRGRPTPPHFSIPEITGNTL